MIVRLPNPMSAVVWLAFLVPAAIIYPGLDRSFGLGVFLLAGALLIAKPSPWETRGPSVQAFKLFSLLQFCGIVSYVYSAAFNGIQIGLWDWIELPRYLVLGVFVVYLIRHSDSSVRVALEWAMTAALYASLAFPAADPQGYITLMTLCYQLFFARLRLRLIHAATALLVVVFTGSRTAWTAAALVVSAALCLQLYRTLVRHKKKSAHLVSLLLFILLLGAGALWGRAATDAARNAEALRFIRSSPVLGWGPAQYEGFFAGANQYEAWLLKGGLLGAGLIIAGAVLSGYRLLRAASGHLEHFIGAAVFLATIAIMLCASPFLESYSLFFLTSFFMAGIHEACR